ncbi:MAG: ankyrin repeat domain-containing protein [Syntrophorhabdaceae bacterium]|nr:ankyrin repeat domain-containing protein [Syntrophorhabdaceae bacterium]MDD5245512.1 ankyrin repeat domain-containing protein [Syntrophorhabdaceae bacterium]
MKQIIRCLVLALELCLITVFVVSAGELENKLMDEAINNQANAVRTLIEKGANVNAKDSDGYTALLWAAYYGNTDVVRALIEKGADVNAQNKRKQTPLHLAADKGHTNTARLLVEKGADVNAKDTFGDTPAITADKQNHPQTAAIIRSQGGGSARQDFDALIKSGSRNLETIVRMARSLKPPPTVPQAARDEMTKGMAAFKFAKRPEDFAAAEEHFDRASRLAPWLPEPYFNLALAQEKGAYARGQQRKFHDALQSLEKYLIAVSDPKDIQAGKQKMAELDIQIKRYDDYASEVNAGVTAYKKGPGGYTEAIRHWRKAVEIYPDHPEADRAYFNIGEVYMYQGDLDGAYKNMQKAFDLMPDPSESDRPGRYTNMGVVLERRGDRARACIYYRKGCNNGSKVSCGNMSNCP